MDAPISAVRVSAYEVPTETPESDGTLEWDSTTLVLCEVEAAGLTGIGWSYTDVAAALLIEGLAPLLEGGDGLATGARWEDMAHATRNLGRPGITATAIAACRLTLAAGAAGVGFHAWGVHRNHGGWGNWRQNMVQGPPLFAPPAYIGLSRAGLGALDLIERTAR